MKTETFIKLNDLCTGDIRKTSSMCCNGVDGCPKHGVRICVFPQVPLTCIDDMVRYVCFMRCPFCEVPVDNVMDELKGY